MSGCSVIFGAVVGGSSASSMVTKESLVIPTSCLIGSDISVIESRSCIETVVHGVVVLHVTVSAASVVAFVRSSGCVTCGWDITDVRRSRRRRGGLTFFMVWIWRLWVRILMRYWV